MNRCPAGLNRRFRRDKVGVAVLFAISLSIQAVAQSTPQAGPTATQALVSLRALMRRVEAESPRPAKLSATQVNENGYWQQLDADAASVGILRSLLPAMRHANPELIAYWTSCTASPNMAWDRQFKLEETDGHRFAARVLEHVVSSPVLAPWAGKLKVASDALLNETLKAQHIQFEPEGEEKNTLRRTLDIEGKRRDLSKIIQEMLGAAGELNPETNAAWTSLYQFLKQSIDESWTTLKENRDVKIKAGYELRNSFLGAAELPSAATAHFEKLEAIDVRLNSMKVDLLEGALAPGQTPMAFLEGNVAQQFINAQIEFDRELVSALDSPSVRSNPALIRVFGALYPIWTPLDRYQDFLNSSRWVYSVDLLMQIARTGLMAESWSSQEFDPDTGRSTSQFVVQRAGQTIDSLNKYREAWLEPNAPEVPLYAAVEVDEHGQRVWTHFNWILWKWITASDLDDLKVDGRVVEGIGQRWLLPANSSVKSIGSLKDVHAADARQLIVALGPARASSLKRKAAK